MQIRPNIKLKKKANIKKKQIEQKLIRHENWTEQKAKSTYKGNYE